jgi:predicted dinucleotide-binding enzyme
MAAGVAEGVTGAARRGRQPPVVIDVTNPLTGRDVHTAPDFLHKATSATAAYASALPGARVYKALNTIGAQHYGSPPAPSADGLWAGPPAAEDAAGAAVVERVITDAGFSPVWVGPARYARCLEAVAELWVGMAYVSAAHGGDAEFALGIKDRGSGAGNGSVGRR